jgi:hypothetical protein
MAALQRFEGRHDRVTVFVAFHFDNNALISEQAAVISVFSADESTITRQRSGFFDNCPDGRTISLLERCDQPTALRVNRATIKDVVARRKMGHVECEKRASQIFQAIDAVIDPMVIPSRQHRPGIDFQQVRIVSDSMCPEFVSPEKQDNVGKGRIIFRTHDSAGRKSKLKPSGMIHGAFPS